MDCKRKIKTGEIISKITNDTDVKTQLGDADGDGIVTLKDAQKVLQVALRIFDLSEEEQAVADVDGDSNLTLKDAQLVLKAALNIITL